MVQLLWFTEALKFCQTAVGTFMAANTPWQCDWKSHFITVHMYCYFTLKNIEYHILHMFTSVPLAQ